MDKTAEIVVKVKGRRDTRPESAALGAAGGALGAGVLRDYTSMRRLPAKAVYLPAIALGALGGAKLWGKKKRKAETRVYNTDALHKEAMRLTPGRPPKPIQQRAPKGAAEEAMMFLSPIETKVAMTQSTAGGLGAAAGGILGKSSLKRTAIGAGLGSMAGMAIHALRKKKKATVVDDGGYA